MGKKRSRSNKRESTRSTTALRVVKDSTTHKLSKSRKEALIQKKVNVVAPSSSSSSSSSSSASSSLLTRNVFNDDHRSTSDSLVSSIFGNSNNQDSANNIGLFSENSSSSSNNNSNNNNNSSNTINSNILNSIFSTKTANELSQVTKDRIKTNENQLQKSMKSNGHSIISMSKGGKVIKNQHDLFINEEERKHLILDKRKKNNLKQDVIDTIESISVTLPEFVDNDDDKSTYTSTDEIHDYDKCNDDNDDSTNNGIIRLFTYQADAIMRNNGVLILKSKTQQQTQNKYIFHAKLLKAMSQKAKEIENDTCKKLHEKGRVWLQQQQQQKSTTQSEKDHAFQYYEVASRCFGRLDIRYKMNEPPFTNKNVISNPFILPIMKSLLGPNAVLVYAGLILSFPNSADQPWHQDGTTLFDESDGLTSDMHLPPYAMNVFIPLDDVEYDVGPTEFYVGSHVTARARQIMEMSQSSTSDMASNNGGECVEDCSVDDNVHTTSTQSHDKPIGPLLKCGDVLIYDYRVCHRGTRNLTTDKTRPMLYLMYARPWFQEHLNFGQEHLFVGDK